MRPENRGVACNIPESIEKILYDDRCYEHICEYRNGELVRHESVPIEPDIERVTDPAELAAFLLNRKKCLSCS